MKKFIILFLCIGLFAVSMNSCLNSYLDKAPEAGLSEGEVFSKYANYMKYFDAVYGEGAVNMKNAYSFYFTLWGFGYTWDALTDMCDMGRLSGIQSRKAGLGAGVDVITYNEGARPIMKSMFSIIRRSNMTLEHIGMLKDGNPDDVNDMIAQAHFVRAFAHLTLFRIWGGLPYLTKSLGSDDQWDIPRLSKHETLMRIAADMDTAVTYFAKANRMRRDPVGGQVGNLNSPDQSRPNGVAAKAIKARVLLYAASPFNNELGAKDWEEAAKANWEAIHTAEQYGYYLLSSADYKTNLVGSTYTNEQLWAWSAGKKAYNDAGIKTILNGLFAGDQNGPWAESPTQNAVDKFETKYGEPLNTDADRQAAIAAGHFKEQDPYANRDPRFYIDIIYNQAPIIGWLNGKAQIYYQMVNGVPTYSQLLNQAYKGITHTGYYNRKLWGDQSVNNKIQPAYTDPIIRLAELYLNYAESANEAYGPNTPSPDANMTAVQAINKIRTRIGMPDVLSAFTLNKDLFRSRIKNERNVELMFEGHYFYDIRRWMDAPVSMAGPLYGMDIEKVTVNSTYPTGFKYTRLPLDGNRQSHWKDEMYYFPFDAGQMYKMKNFIPNPVW